MAVASSVWVRSRTACQPKIGISSSPPATQNAPRAVSSWRAASQAST
jgi:hypothetical protein